MQHNTISDRVYVSDEYLALHKPMITMMIRIQ